MELVNAKCPNCKAEIQVNKDLEKTICQYCGETVSIKEALELADVKETGIKVDGVKSDSKKFEEVEKYFKLKEYANAKKTLDKIIANDEFNIEANCKWIYSVIMFYNMNETTFGDYDIAGENTDKWRYILKIYDKYKRLTVIDEKNEREQYIKEFSNTLEALNKYVSNFKSTEDVRKQLSEKLAKASHQYCKTDRLLFGENYSDSTEYRVTKVLNIISKNFGINKIEEWFWYNVPGARKNRYLIPYFKFEICNYGFFLRYFKPEKDRFGYTLEINDYRNPSEYWKYFKWGKEIKNIQDIERIVNSCESELTKKGLFKLF